MVYLMPIRDIHSNSEAITAMSELSSKNIDYNIKIDWQNS